MISYTFPGQGSLPAGAGRCWSDHPSWVLVEALSDASGRDLGHLLLDADADELRSTGNNQVATFALSLVVHAAVEELGIAAGAAAGHSLGEYSALVAAGVLSPTDAAALVGARARAMQAAADARPGTMAAVLGLDDDSVAAACAAGADAWLANLNAPGQAVISGTDAGLARAGAAAREAGARKILPLAVGGAFHSPLMAPAARALAAAIADADLRDGRIPVVANVDARAHSSAEEWRSLLVEQLTSPVRWRSCLHTLHDLGVSLLVELGPGGVLTGLAKRTLPDITRVAVATPDDLTTVVQLAADAAPGASPPDGDHLHGPERLVVSPAAGRFSPAERLAPGLRVDVGHLLGRVGDIDVRSRFAGVLAGIMALPGERLAPAQPIAWLRAC